MDSNAYFSLLRFLLTQFWNVTFNYVARSHPILRYLNRGHPEVEHRLPRRPLSRKEDTNEPCIGRASNFNLELDMIRIG